jgi:hypothetical protein
VFTDNSDPTAVGGTLRAEGSFIHEANRVFGKRLVEWSGTVVFEFAEGTVTAHVEDSSSSYTVNLGAGNDDDLVE